MVSKNVADLQKAVASLTESTSSVVKALEQTHLLTHSTAVISAAAVLDDRLARSIQKTMKPLSKKIAERVFDFPGPLNSFSNKIVMAYALGIIPKHVFDELEKIRAMRNTFSHSKDRLTFESEQIIPIFNSLTKPSTTKTRHGEIFAVCVTELTTFFDKLLSEKDKSVPS